MLGLLASCTAPPSPEAISREELLDACIGWDSAMDALAESGDTTLLEPEVRENAEAVCSQTRRLDWLHGKEPIQAAPPASTT
jgi:hypothetical protein